MKPTNSLCLEINITVVLKRQHSFRKESDVDNVSCCSHPKIINSYGHNLRECLLITYFHKVLSVRIDGGTVNWPP